MKKIGRNTPCPCGSGKKYKKCCMNTPKLPSGGRFVYTDLDLLSNKVRDLIDQGRLEEAEAACRQLMEEYPETIDGLHRYAELFEARGENRKAAEYYRKAVTFAQLNGGFDRRTIEGFRKKAFALDG